MAEQRHPDQPSSASDIDPGRGRTDSRDATRRRTGTGYALLVLGALLFAFTLTDRLYFWSVLGKERLPGLGNYEENVRKLAPARSGRFRFAVLGDSVGYRDVYEELMEKAKTLGAAFVLFTGDLVYRPRRESFELFNHDYHSLGDGALPMFIAIGNHDKPPVSLFRHYYGPENFSFVYEGCLFIFGDNNRPEDLPGCAGYVSAEIARHRDAVDRVFITLHHPIIDYPRGGGISPDSKGNPELHRVLAAEDVDAVFMGHFHGFFRTQLDETLMVITGGAGASFHDEESFHHMVLVDVAPDGITDTVVRAATTTKSLVDRFRLEFLEAHVHVLGTWWGALASLAAAATLFLAGRRLSKRPYQ